MMSDTRDRLRSWLDVLLATRFSASCKIAEFTDILLNELSRVLDLKLLFGEVVADEGESKAEVGGGVVEVDPPEETDKSKGASCSSCRGGGEGDGVGSSRPYPLEK